MEPLMGPGGGERESDTVSGPLLLLYLLLLLVLLTFIHLRAVPRYDIRGAACPFGGEAVSQVVLESSKCCCLKLGM